MGDCVGEMEGLLEGTIVCGGPVGLCVGVIVTGAGVGFILGFTVGFNEGLLVE